MAVISYLSKVQKVTDVHLILSFFIYPIYQVPITLFVRSPWADERAEEFSTIKKQEIELGVPFRKLFIRHCLDWPYSGI